MTKTAQLWVTLVVLALALIAGVVFLDMRADAAAEKRDCQLDVIDGSRSIWTECG